MKDADGSNPSDAIIRQEKRGQQSLTNNTRLPRDMKDNARAILEAMGVVFGDDIDDLFVAVTLPDTWRIVPTDHDMYSNLETGSGEVFATIFYNAAAYDREAFLYLKPQ